MSSSIIKLDEAFLPEAKRLSYVARRARREAEFHIALTQMADTTLRMFLEKVSGLELVDGNYQLDADKGYLIPTNAKTSTEETATSSEPISLTERRKSRKK